MEHFSVVQALCRAALAHQNPAIRRQVERLRDALRASGPDEQAGAIEGLLTRSERVAELIPSRLVRSTLIVSGEELTARTQVPVDRETAQPLADILLQERLPESAPILVGDIAAAAEALLEEWNGHELLASMGIRPARTCLIYGAPGTGKTHLALWIASQLHTPVVLARLDGLISSYLGTTARNIASLFSFANRYRCILLLDEFDAIAKLRDDPQEVGEIKRVVNAVLQNLDARRDVGFTIGITNHETLLDPAIWRRFDSQIAIPRPSFPARKLIAQRYFGALAVSDALVSLVAWFAEGGTGAEIESFVSSLQKRLAFSDGLISPIDSLRRVIALHAGRIIPERRAQLALAPEELAVLLLQDGDLDFDQADVADVFGRDPATISRWVRGSAQTRNTRRN